VCFASIRFRHRQITLPLFERDWQRLKLTLRHNSLPKVQFATKTLPKDFPVLSETRRPYLQEKSVFAVVFIWQPGKVFLSIFFSISLERRTCRLPYSFSL